MTTEFGVVRQRETHERRYDPGDTTCGREGQHMVYWTLAAKRPVRREAHAPGEESPLPPAVISASHLSRVSPSGIARSSLRS